MSEYKKIFINMTAHSLTSEQIREAMKFAGTIVSANDILPKALVEKLRQCPSDVDELADMANELDDILLDYALREKAILYVHLPVGSPAFMWILSILLAKRAYVFPVFSHTKRRVVDIPQSDGSVVKKSIFKFEEFIFPTGGEPLE